VIVRVIVLVVLKPLADNGPSKLRSRGGGGTPGKSKSLGDSSPPKGDRRTGDLGSAGLNWNLTSPVAGGEFGSLILRVVILWVCDERRGADIGHMGVVGPLR
jgi:hypothetical protein